MANDSDTDALLKDLETKASSGGDSAASSDGGGDEDIEAFLRDLEGDDYVPPAESETKTKTKTADPDPLDDEFAALEEAPDAPMEKAPDKPKKKSRKEKRAEKKAAKKAEKEAAAGEVAVVERGESNGLKVAGQVFKWGVVLIPTGLAWWILGSYLANWISAGWLVFAVATVLVLGLPLAARLAVKKGRYIWWTAGLSTALTVALVAPMTASAGQALARYGHWPSTATAEVAGLDSDSFLVSMNATIAGWVSGLVHPTQDEEYARNLGTEDALDPADAPSGDEKPADDTEKPADDTEKPAEDAEKPEDDTEKPADDTEKPADDTEKPAEDAEKPADTEKPADDTEKPAADTEEPAADGEAPAEPDTP